MVTNILQKNNKIISIINYSPFFPDAEKFDRLKKKKKLYVYFQATKFLGNLITVYQINKENKIL